MMTRPPVFRTVRARLLALMAAILLPVAFLALVLASASYRSTGKSIRLAQVETVSGFVVRSRVWFRGTLRTLVAVASQIAAPGPGERTCEATLQNLLASVDGFRAIRVKLASGVECHASRVEGADAALMRGVSEALARRPEIARPTPGSAEARYDTLQTGDALHLVLHARSTAGSAAPGWEAILFVDPALLDQAFELGTADSRTVVALMRRGSSIIVARGASEGDRAWLPQEEMLSPETHHWRGTSIDGTSYTYASQILVAPDLYILARFDDAALRAARVQFLLLALTPLLILLLLGIGYAKGIQRVVLQWIGNIEQTAIARKNNPADTALVPVDPRMPHDIRSVATAFNDMVEDLDRREAALKQVLGANQLLMRELHHRVKNSLQVIQSYLALSRRHETGAKKAYLRELESKVQVLTTAYRLALTDSGMKPVHLEAFVQEILRNLMLTIRPGKHRLETEVQCDAGLIVDRVIPLGLALVEAVLAGFEVVGATVTVVRCAMLPDGRVELRVSTDGTFSHDTILPKIADGLAAQLGASIGEAAEGDILLWRFTA